MTGPVHFIWLGGDWCWQFKRAVLTAKVHDAPIYVWRADYDAWPLRDFPRVEFHDLDLPDWLRDHPIKLANVKDLFAYNILHEHGGLYLDLDTISLRSVWGLLGDADLCVSTEFPSGQEAGRAHNTAVMVGRKGGVLLANLARWANAKLRDGESEWGAIGPHLVSDYAVLGRGDFGEMVAAPYPLLSGWSYHSIGDYYANPRDPGEDVRVIHLYSSDNLGAFYADRWMP